MHNGLEQGKYRPMEGDNEEARKRLEEANVNIDGMSDQETKDFVANYEAMVTGEIDKMTPQEKDKMMDAESGEETNH